MIIRITQRTWDALVKENDIDGPLIASADQAFEIVDDWMVKTHGLLWSFGWSSKATEVSCAWCACPIGHTDDHYLKSTPHMWVCLNCVADAALTAGVLTSIPRAWIESE